MSKHLLFSLKNKVAVITGGAGNLGQFWAEALENAGATIALIDLPGNIKSSYRLYKCDITDAKSLTQIHSEIKKDIGLVSVLVNNAGIDAPPGTGISDFRKVWQVNVEAAARCISEFIPDMKELKKGSVINIGSIYLERSPDERIYRHLNTDKPWIYGSSKAALHGLTLYYATRLAKSAIRVNTLSPGGVFNNQDPVFVRKYSEKVPLGRMADKNRDLAGPLIFLASDASTYVTGINLQVNGGFTAW